MNIPVPPIVIMESVSNKVLDGTQRLLAIRDFYEQRFELEGLEYLQELEGLSYDNLPLMVKSRLDAQHVSVVLLIALTPEPLESIEAIVLKRLRLLH